MRWWEEPELTQAEREANTREEYSRYDALPKRVRTFMRLSPVDMSAREVYRVWMASDKDLASFMLRLRTWQAGEVRKRRAKGESL
jgi:hypothetical protein